jgi:hypothetical protein
VQEPKLWYGIGILYDRYGSLEHAEEAFSQVMRMQPDFEKANEIYFRLGIIYKQQQKYQQSLEVRGIQGSGFVTHISDCSTVFPIHCLGATNTADRRRYLVPNWPCPRTAEGRKLSKSFLQNYIPLTFLVRQCENGVQTCA